MEFRLEELTSTTTGQTDRKWNQKENSSKNSETGAWQFSSHVWPNKKGLFIIVKQNSHLRYVQKYCYIYVYIYPISPPIYIHIHKYIYKHILPLNFWTKFKFLWVLLSIFYEPTENMLGLMTHTVGITKVLVCKKKNLTSIGIHEKLRMKTNEFISHQN